MLVDDYTVAVLEFSAVLRLLGAGAISDPGKRWILSLQPAQSRTDAETLRDAIKECMDEADRGNPLAVEPFEDLSGLFRRLRPNGAVLDGVELVRFLPLLRSSSVISRVLRSSDGLVALRTLVGTVQTVPSLLNRLDGALLPDGGLQDGASPELGRLRKEIARSEQLLDARLEALLRDPAVRPHLQDFYVTRRGDRCVIPVKRAEQGRVQGVLHDLSQSGETAFIEPLATLPLGNELLRLQALERLEIRNILAFLSQAAREYLPLLEENYRCLTMVDGIAALAAYGISRKWVACPFREDNGLRLRGCRHPLLEQRLRDEGTEKGIVPLSLELNPADRGLVLSGSNTGGKTVILKTVGLLALLASCGLPLPAAEGTELPWLSRLSAVIGDEQSIDQDLSTFSARMKRVVLMVRDAEPGSLALIDELGSGTDPAEGSALACAILGELTRKGVRVLASTHLGAVKAFAHTAEGFSNAAVSFDPLTLMPTYRLQVGEPGSSHAMEIARRVGLENALVAEAREYLGPGQGRLEDLLSDLNDMRRRAAEELTRAAELTAALEREQQVLHRQREETEQRRKETLRAAIEEGKALVVDARRRIDLAIAEFRKIRRITLQCSTAAADEELPSEYRDVLTKLSGELESRYETLKPEAPEPLSPDLLRPGTPVYVGPLHAHGLIEEVDRKHGKCTVTAGSVSVAVSWRDLFPSREKPGRQTDAPVSMPLREPGEGAPGTNELVLVGQRVDPALSALDRFLDAAVQQGFRTVRIVHGLGTGVLGKAVREYLEDHPAVHAFRSGDSDSGGEAVTVAEIQ